MHSYPYTRVFSLLLFATFAPAMQAAAQQLSPAQAVDLALKNNPSILAARAAINSAAAYSKYAGRWENPSLKLSYGTDRAFNDEGEENFSIGFEQRFPLTNRLKLLKDVSATEVQLSQVELRNQERLLIRDTESTVARIKSLDQRLSLLDEMLTLEERFASLLENRIERGEASTLDINRVRVATFSIKQEIHSLRKERQATIGTLCTLIGSELNTEIEIRAQAFPSKRMPDPHPLNSAALESHPEYQLKALLADIVKGQTSVYRAERWADLAVEVFFEEERAVDEPVGLSRDRFFGVGVSIPLPLRNSQRGSFEASRLRERQLRHELQAVELRLQNNATSLHDQAAATYEQATLYEENVLHLAKENLDEINNAYAAGQVDLGDVFRVQEQHLDIQRTQLELWHELEQLIIEWRAATAQNLTAVPSENFSK